MRDLRGLSFYDTDGNEITVETIYGELKKHNHDSEYTKIGHTHSQYSQNGHTHDERYSIIGHTHTNNSSIGGPYSIEGHGHSQYVSKTGNEEIKGIKTFRDGIIIENMDESDYNSSSVATRKYVELDYDNLVLAVGFNNKSTSSTTNKRISLGFDERGVPVIDYAWWWGIGINPGYMAKLDLPTRDGTLALTSDLPQIDMNWIFSSPSSFISVTSMKSKNLLIQVLIGVDLQNGTVRTISMVIPAYDKVKSYNNKMQFCSMVSTHNSSGNPTFIQASYSGSEASPTLGISLQNAADGYKIVGYAITPLS